MSNITITNLSSNESPFDRIRRVDEQGLEYWSARELMPLLGYSRWHDFADSIERAKISCQNAGNPLPENFSGLILKSGGRPKEDYRLSRYASYLVAMNGDPRKTEISAAQNYFAHKTREAEVAVLRPKTALELAKEQVKLLEQIELQEIQIKLLEQENEHLAEAVDELFQYSSIIRIAKFNNVPEVNFYWRKLKATSIQLGLEVKQVPCPRFGAKNLYHHDVWRYLHPNVILPDTTTLRLPEGDN